MHPHHRTREEKLGLAFRDGASALALELSQTQDATIRRSATARAHGTGPAGSRAFSQSSSGQSSSRVPHHCLAGAEVTGAEAKGHHSITARFQERRSG
jgi:hypothetical protein